MQGTAKLIILLPTDKRPRIEQPKEAAHLQHFTAVHLKF